VEKFSVCIFSELQLAAEYRVEVRYHTIKTSKEISNDDDKNVSLGYFLIFRDTQIT
jgi:hypothetical protein